MKITIDPKTDGLANVLYVLAEVYCMKINFRIVAENCNVEFTTKNEPIDFNTGDDDTGEEGRNGQFGAPVDPPIITGGNDEFEPDDADDFPSDLKTGDIVPGGEVVPLVPPPPPAATIAQVLPVPPQSTTITVSPPPAPDTRVVATVPQGSAQSVTVDEELDSDGKPWDATIHSETRAKNQDGTWRNRRRTKNVEVKQAIPGLEAITPNSVPAPPRERKTVRTFVYVNGAQDIIAAPEGATDAELSAITGKPTTRHAPETTAAPAVPVVPAVPPPPPAAPPVVKTAPQGSPVGTWAELMERVTKYFGAQKLTTKDLNEVCATFSIGSIQECYAHPTLIPMVGAAIDEKAAEKGGV